MFGRSFQFILQEPICRYQFKTFFKAILSYHLFEAVFQTWFCLFGLYRSVFASSDKFFMWNLCHQIVFHDSNSVLKKTDLSQWICLWSSSKFFQGSCSPQLIIIGIRFDGQLVVFLDFDLLVVVVVANQMQSASTFASHPNLWPHSPSSNHIEYSHYACNVYLPNFTRKKTCFVVDVFNHDDIP